MSLRTWRCTPILFVLLSAVCFGASTPFAKVLLADIDPIPLAALLYLGGGVVLACYKLALPLVITEQPRKDRLTRADVPWLLGMIVAGGVIAPILLMISLRHTPAATASLLLNFEGVATALIAATIFRERIGARVWWAIMLITAACAVLTADVHGAWALSLGAVGVLAACTCWGIDNNVMRQIADKDPLSIAMIKCLSAGGISLGVALLLHKPLPGIAPILWAALLGGIGYGLSIMLFLLALRDLGAARTSGFFASAPFVGAILSFLLLHESLGAQFLLALPLLIIGVILLARESYDRERLRGY